MRFFPRVSVGRALQLLKPISRAIWNFNPPKPAVAIGGKTISAAVLTSLAQYGKQSHPLLTLIYVPDWLENSHKYHANEKWGQTKHGLPKVLKDIFSTMHPNYPDNEYLTWGHVLELNRTVLYMINKVYGVPVFYGQPIIKRLENNSFNITVGNAHFNTPADTHFYVFSQEPRKHGIPEFKERSSTELYKLHPSELPLNLDILAIGEGLSIFWLAKHFQNLVVCIKREAFQLTKNVPSNFEVDLSRIVVLDYEKLEISKFKDNAGLTIIKDKVSGKEYIGILCTAKGFEVPYSLVKDVPEAQLTSPKNWIESKWISQKNIPQGSLLEKFVQLLETTDNLDRGYELQSYHQAFNPYKVLLSNCISSGINIDEKYLTELENSFTANDNPLPDWELNRLFINKYEEIYKPTPKDKSLFQKEITLFSNKRVDMISKDKIAKPLPEFSV